MFIATTQGGSGARPLYATTTPNPGGQQNFFYTANDDELTLENLKIDGSVTLNGSTITTWPSGGGGSLTIQDEGSSLSTAGTTLNFVGSGVVASGTGTTKTITISGGGNLNNIVEDTTPQLGGNLDGQAFTITTTGDITAANFNTTSDESLKDNVETIGNALDKVLQLRGVNFNWIENGEAATGVIAQEVEKVIPEVVAQRDDGTKTVSYGNLVGILIEAIKEQQKKIDELKD
jgi:hypothetical protein